MKLIELTQGQFAKVDDEDYDFLMQWKWTAQKHCDGFYAVRTCYKNKTKKRIIMHRLIMNVTDKNILIDHKNRDKLDNQRSNLRTCTHSQNMQNRSPVRSRETSSKYLGVSYIKRDGYWQASIKSNGLAINIGWFKSEREAALAYNKKALELHKEFANLNIID